MPDNINKKIDNEELDLEQLEKVSGGAASDNCKAGGKHDWHQSGCNSEVCRKCGARRLIGQEECL